MCKSTVRFHTVEIIELPLCVGDNPAVSAGVPISLDWDAQRRTTLSLDWFEAIRPPFTSTRRLSSRRRKSILLKNGCSPHEIKLATLEAEITKQQRIHTMLELKQQAKLAILEAEITKQQRIHTILELKQQASRKIMGNEQKASGLLPPSRALSPPRALSSPHPSRRMTCNARTA
jgi:hypothetical protein